MGKFHDILEGAAELPDDIKSVLTSAYEEDFSVADAKVGELSNIIATKDETINQITSDSSQQISSLKSANYDLLRAVPGNANAGATDNKDTSSEDRQITIADLFGKK